MVATTVAMAAFAAAVACHVGGGRTAHIDAAAVTIAAVAHLIATMTSACPS